MNLTPINRQNIYMINPFTMKKISIISGGSSGLGFQIAGLLKNSGRMVLILGRDKSKLENATLALNKSLSENPALSYGM